MFGDIWGCCRDEENFSFPLQNTEVHQAAVIIHSLKINFIFSFLYYFFDCRLSRDNSVEDYHIRFNFFLIKKTS